MMTLMSPEIYLFVIFFWLFVLTYLFWRIFRQYNQLTAGVEKKNLQQILGELLKGVRLDRKEIERLREECQAFKDSQNFVFQKVGFLRFNPFKDMGGNQSFVLALLDNRNSGIVITSLHGRTGSRWYTKLLKNGQCQEVELSEEEEKVIKIARNLKS